MQHSATIYIKGDSFIHRLDPRAKLVILAVYSCALFFVNGWLGMVFMGALFALALAASRLPARKVLACGAVVYVLAAFAVLFNCIRFSEGHPFFSLVGFETGCLYAVRILLLFWMSLLLCFTSTSTDLMAGFAKLLSPLRAFRVPVDDVALVLSLALRFIPLTSAECAQIRQAQRARCAHFDDGTLWQRFQAAGNAFNALFVGLFRRADRLALAMDARCYGIPQTGECRVGRTSLNTSRIGIEDVLTLTTIVAFCIGIAVIF